MMVNYDSRVVIDERKMFIRLATDVFLCYFTEHKMSMSLQNLIFLHTFKSLNECNKGCGMLHSIQYGK